MAHRLTHMLLYFFQATSFSREKDPFIRTEYFIIIFAEILPYFSASDGNFAISSSCIEKRLKYTGSMELNVLMDGL